MPDRRVWRHCETFHPERPLDILVPEMPEVTFASVLVMLRHRVSPSGERDDRLRRSIGYAALVRKIETPAITGSFALADDEGEQ